MNHNGNANKMVSAKQSEEQITVQATPDGELRRQILSPCVAKNEREWWAARMIEKLEFELNAANDRIRQLEAVVNDPEVLWTNWLRGTVKLPVGIGDVRQYQDRIKRLEEAGDVLKSSADAADDDIGEHLQVANYNLHGLLNTGERIEPPNPPERIHQAGIDVSVAVRKNIRKALIQWTAAKEAKS